MPVKYNSSGRASLAQMITGETTCTMDTSTFPYDRHTCSIQFLINHYEVTVLSKFGEFLLAAFKPDGSWNVVNVTREELQNIRINVNLVLARKPAFVLVNLVLPMAMLALMSPLVFLLPNQSGERVAFSITVLLATSVFMTVVADHVPQKSNPFPLILTMFFISYSLTVLVVIIVIINARIYRLPDHVRIPSPIYLLLRVTRLICCCFRGRAQNEATDDDDECETVEDGGELRLKMPDTERKDVLCRQAATWRDVGWAIDMSCMCLLYLLKIGLIVGFLVMLSNKN